MTGHTAAILKEIPAMGCDASKSNKIAAKWSVSSHRVARPNGTFQNSCGTPKAPAMFCNAFSNLLDLLLPNKEYLRYLLSDLQTIFSTVIEILYLFM